MRSKHLSVNIVSIAQLSAAHQRRAAAGGGSVVSEYASGCKCTKNQVSACKRMQPYDERQAAASELPTNTII